MTDEWCFNVEGLGKVRVSTKLIEALSTYRQINSSQPESGGVLLGRHLNSNGALLIDSYTPPQTSDTQGRCSFYRSNAHNKLVERTWKESKGHVTYVGLWHTHPEPIPTPSRIDTQDWSNALSKSSFEGAYLFFFIVGQTSIRCWSGKKQRFSKVIKFSGEYTDG